MSKKNADSVENLDIEQINHALGAIESILDMLKPSQQAAMNVVGATVGLALWKFYDEDDVEDTLKRVCIQARLQFKSLMESEQEEEEGAVDLEDIEAGTPH